LDRFEENHGIVAYFSRKKSIISSSSSPCFLQTLGAHGAVGILFRCVPQRSFKSRCGSCDPRTLEELSKLVDNPVKAGCSHQSIPLDRDTFLQFPSFFDCHASVTRDCGITINLLRFFRLACRRYTCIYTRFVFLTCFIYHLVLQSSLSVGVH